MAEDITKLVATQANKTADVMSQLGRKGLDFSTLPAFNRDVIEIGNHRIQEKQQAVDGSNLVWGNPDYGIWGSFLWGTNSNPYEVTAVYNDNDWFPEGFWNDRFIDTGSSTGSYFSNSEIYQLDNNEVLQSTFIAKENKIYKSVLVKLKTEYAGGTLIGSDANDSITIKASNDGGSTWQTVTEGVTSVLTGGTTDGLKVKFINENNDTGLLTIPVTVPFDFSKSSINIKEYNVKYYS